MVDETGPSVEPDAGEGLAVPGAGEGPAELDQGERPARSGAEERPRVPGAEPPVPSPAPAPADAGAGEPGAGVPGAAAVPAILAEEPPIPGAEPVIPGGELPAGRASAAVPAIPGEEPPIPGAEPVAREVAPAVPAASPPPWADPHRPRGLDAPFAAGGENAADPSRRAREARDIRLLVLFVGLLVGVPTVLTFVALFLNPLARRGGG